MKRVLAVKLPVVKDGIKSRIKHGITKTVKNAGYIAVLTGAGLAILFIGSFIGQAVLDFIWQILEQQNPNSDELLHPAGVLVPGGGDKSAYEFALMLGIGTLPIILICLFAHFLVQHKTRFQSYIGVIHFTDFIGWFLLSIILVFICIGIIVFFSTSELIQHSLTAPYYPIAGPLCSLAFAWCLQAMSEEFLFRGLLLPAITYKIGIRAAIMFNVVFFSLLHSWNAETSLLMLVNIGVFGVLTCLLVLYTGRIWAAVGLHAGWNFAQDYLAGIPVSGGGLPDHPVLLRLVIDGPDWLTGGAPGLEGSTLTTIIFGSACGIYLMKFRTRHIRNASMTGV